MSRADSPQPRSNDTNNPSGAFGSTWEDERRDVTSFARLSSDSKESFLSMVGFLFGFRVDCNSGPRRVASRVAVLKSTRQACFHEATGLDTENIITQNERDANYTRHGWSLSALSQASPWTRSRIANNSQPNRLEESLTKRAVACRLQVDVLLQDLSPVPEFEAEVKEALGMSTRFEVFRALYQMFERWGDMIPLSFDAGTSLAITDLKSSQEAYPVRTSNSEMIKIFENKTAVVSARGIDMNPCQEEEKYGLCDPDIPVGRWSQVRVTKAAPVTALLCSELQTQLSELRNSLISYLPLSLGGDTNSGYAFDDTSHALKTIRSITFNSTDRVNLVRVAYADGTYSPERGGKKGLVNVFDLEDGEYISQVLIWGDSGKVSSIQFFTTAGRASQAYGGTGGRPAVLKTTGGVLVAFAGKIKDDAVHQLQGIWRHDIQRVGPSEEGQYSGFYGAEGGSRQNDLPLLLKHPRATISKVMVRHSSNRVRAIQFTYEYQEGSHTVTVEGSYFGGRQDDASTFNLSPGEYITVVRGRTGPRIIQLCFATNFGRTSSIFGGGEGTEFVCQAPLARDRKAMRLYSIYGRSGSEVDGLAFAWAVV